MVLELAILFALRFLGLLGLEAKLFLQVQGRFKLMFTIAMVEDAFFLAALGLLVKILYESPLIGGVVALGAYAASLLVAYRLTR